MKQHPENLQLIDLQQIAEDAYKSDKCPLHQDSPEIANKVAEIANSIRHIVTNAIQQAIKGDSRDVKQASKILTIITEGLTLEDETRIQNGKNPILNLALKEIIQDAQQRLSIYIPTIQNRSTLQKKAA